MRSLSDLHSHMWHADNIKPVELDLERWWWNGLERDGMASSILFSEARPTLQPWVNGAWVVSGCTS